MKSPQDENFSGLLRLFNGVGNASCFHTAHNPPILQFRPPLFTPPFMCHLNQSNVSLMSSICLLFCISPPLHLATPGGMRSAEVCGHSEQQQPEADLSRGDVGPGVVDADGVGGGVKRGGGGRWVVGLAAHWARGLAHPTTDPALRRGRLQ